jgi:hypothetical protein
MTVGDVKEGPDGEESEYEEEGGSGREEVEGGDVSVLDDVAMAVVPAVPAAQDDGQPVGLSKVRLTSVNLPLLSRPAQSLPSPTTSIVVAPSMKHPARSLSANNASSLPSERSKRTKTRGNLCTW